MFHQTIARVCGEAFDADQIAWACDECSRDEYSCTCEDAPRCLTCDDELPESGVCADCTEPAKLDASWTIRTQYHGKGRGSVAA